MNGCILGKWVLRGGVCVIDERMTGGCTMSGWVGGWVIEV